jgi:solute carrier family 45 protein 1/2/4
VFSFYLLDFCLNALQGSLRNLLLDITPAEQLGKANAWHGRMTHAGNILGMVLVSYSISRLTKGIGFTFGFLDLGEWPILRPLGGDQFRKVCIVAVIILVITVWITCATQHEKARKREPDEAESGWVHMFVHIVSNG